MIEIDIFIVNFDEIFHITLIPLFLMEEKIHLRLKSG